MSDDDHEPFIDSSGPLLLYSSPQPLLLPSAAEVTAHTDVLNADPSMKHVAQGEAAQDSGKFVLMAYKFRLISSLREQQQ